MSELIESLIRRAKGTRVTMGNTNYHFRPDAADRHVAEVENDAHIARFLAITEGYRAVERLPSSVTDTQGIKPATSQAPTQPPAPPVSTIVPQSDTDTGTGDGDIDQTNTEAAKQQAPGAAGEIDAGGGVDTAKTQAEQTSTPEAPKGEVGAALDKAQATEQYIAKFGKKPHHAWTAEVMLAKIAEG